MKGNKMHKLKSRGFRTSRLSTYDFFHSLNYITPYFNWRKTYRFIFNNFPWHGMLEMLSSLFKTQTLHIMVLLKDM